jgi:fatty acid desaturase
MTELDEGFDNPLPRRLSFLAVSLLTPLYVPLMMGIMVLDSLGTGTGIRGRIDDAVSMALASVFFLAPLFPALGMLLAWCLDRDRYLFLALVPVFVLASWFLLSILAEFVERAEPVGNLGAVNIASSEKRSFGVAQKSHTDRETKPREKTG